MSVIEFPTGNRDLLIGRILSQMFANNPALAFRALVLLVRKEGALVRTERSQILFDFGKQAALLGVPVEEAEAVASAVASAITSSNT